MPRLIPVDYDPFAQLTPVEFDPWAQVASDDTIHTIAPGPEYDKWDEALATHGRIRIPKELDEPQNWLNGEQFKDILKDIDREDRPDGSVILSRTVPTS